MLFFIISLIGICLTVVGALFVIASLISLLLDRGSSASSQSNAGLIEVNRSVSGPLLAIEKHNDTLVLFIAPATEAYAVFASTYRSPKDNDVETMELKSHGSISCEIPFSEELDECCSGWLYSDAELRIDEVVKGGKIVFLGVRDLEGRGIQHIDRTYFDNYQK